MNKNALQKHDGGFTLIEVLIAAAILSVGLLATLSLITTSASGRRVGKDIIIADNLAKRLVEDAKNLGYSATATNMKAGTDVTNTGAVIYEYGTPTTTIITSTPDLYMVKQQTVKAAGKVYTLKLTIRESDPATPRGKMVSFQVDVSWSTSGVPRNATYITYFSK